MIDFAQVQAAAARIAGWIHHTPVLSSRAINRIAGAELFFKCENLQKVGAFKFRGAANAVLSTPADRIRRGVATHSSGNHAAALALAGAMQQTKAYIVMPRTAPGIKKKAVAGYGAEIVLCEPTQQAREDTLQQVVERTGAEFVHPYNDERVIAGQGTCALELIEEIPGIDLIITPVGGGGLLSGTLITASSQTNPIEVWAGEPAGADDAFRSMKSGKIEPSIGPKTIADGLLTSLGTLTFPIIRDHIRRIVTVSDEEIIYAMRLVWERMKIIIEPSSAVPLAAILKEKEKIAGRKIGIIISGGNVDLDHLPWL